MKIILMLISALTLLTTTGCVFRDDRDHGDHWGHRGHDHDREVHDFDHDEHH